MKPTRLLPAIALASLITVEFGGWSLLGFLTGRGRLDAFQERAFRAGHAHAGVLLVLALAALPYLERTRFAPRTQWLAGGLLLAGILAQSGGFFLHLLLGEAGRGSPGTAVTRATVAYEMLGSAADAEDVLQETWLRWSGSRPGSRSTGCASCWCGV